MGKFSKGDMGRIAKKTSEKVSSNDLDAFMAAFTSRVHQQYQTKDPTTHSVEDDLTH